MTKKRFTLVKCLAKKFVDSNEYEIACQCNYCDPPTYLVRSGENYFTATSPDVQRLKLKAYLDGVKQENTSECVTGENGWVMNFVQPTHKCQTCFKGACREVKYGKVEVKSDV